MSIKHLHHRGFTLIELLMVSAIIAVLIGVLLPPLKLAVLDVAAKEAGKNALADPVCRPPNCIGTNSSAPLKYPSIPRPNWARIAR